ncbi:MAG: hypothetical protein IT298_01325 [Chloroflexi bacterium]|nr:MAG: hypothetical protein UZ13_02786 [Chloroflexi bacterium OLB13]MBC6957855.1 hypothetical protein [Chloroflexota bacterium]MBV6437066.1 hypothetical protein [Anaerolineae bacterium]MDL1916548.1 hypothetical protein [Anaerolineae bacterium CFX4]OQY79989.1 MAG: hypothetical protein B6D42_13835 [Anaerolineae bacterium UTCFX5]
MRKYLMILVMIVAMLAIGGTALAQNPVCGNLTGADCEILTQSMAAQEGLTSATFDFTLNITSGADTIPLTGNGSYAIDPAAIAAIDMDALAGAAADPTAVLGALGSVLGAFDGELNINAMGMLDLNLLLIDGVGYLNFAPLAPLLGGPEALAAMGLPADWAGLELVGALEMLAPMMDSMEMPGAGDVPAVDPAQNEAMLNALMSAAVITRGADENGKAVFSTTLDLNAIFNNEQFMSMMMEQAGELSESELAEAQQMMATFGDAITVSVTQKIDLATFYQTDVEFNLAIDGAALAAATGESMDSISVVGAFSFADFNAAPALSAPAGAPVATIMDLMGMMGAMGGF